MSTGHLQRQHASLIRRETQGIIRLQEHIISLTNDQTLFCWSDITITTSGGETNNARYYVNRATNLLAPSPLLFKNCARIAQVPDLNVGNEIKLTKLGLRITGPVYELRTRDMFAGIGDHLMYLRCYDLDAPNHYIAIMIRKLGDDNFARKNQALCRLPGSLWKGTANKMIYIRKEKVIPSYREILQMGKSLAFRINTKSPGETLHVTRSWPPD